MGLTLSWNVFVFILLLLGLGAFSWISYKKTTPPISDIKRTVLLSLRTLSLWIIAFLLFEPVWNRVYEKEERPVIAVLWDASESMGITDNSGSRKDATHRLLQNVVLQDLQKKYDVKSWIFSGAATEFQAGDTLPTNGLITDMGQALDDVKQKTLGENLVAMMLISDGGYNKGAHPSDAAKNLGVPVFTVGVGDPTEAKDLVIGAVNYNETIFAGENLPIDVTFSARGYGGQNINITLEEEGKLLLSQAAPVRADGRSGRMHFDVKSLTEGTHRFTVRIPSLSGELTTRNNSKAFYVKVLKSKIVVDLLSGTSGVDHHFYKLALRNNPKIVLRTWVENKNGELREIKEPGSVDTGVKADVFILNNYPTSVSSSWPSRSAEIASDKKPILIFYGPATDAVKLSQVNIPAQLKFDPTLEENGVFFNLGVAGKNSAILKTSEDPNETARDWGELPPAWISRCIAIPFEGSETLARVDMARATNVLRLRKDIPLIIAGRRSNHKSLLMMTYGFWKSSFVIRGMNKTNDAYDKFLAGGVQWLSTTDDSRPFKISPLKSVFQNGEKIIFSAQIYDESLSAISDAEINLKTKSSSSSFETNFRSLGNGRYEAEFEGLEAGAYSFEAVAKRGEQNLGSEKGPFSVEEFSPEFAETPMNEALMRNLSEATGGKFVTASNIDDLAPFLKFETSYRDIHEEIAIWNKALLLFIIAGLLTVEWWMRKRLQLL